MQPVKTELKLGLASAVAAHLLWGVFPLFWRMVGNVDPLLVVCHRVLWAFGFLLIALPWLFRNAPRRGDFQLSTILRNRRVWTTYGVAGVLIATNWLTFIWAVNHDRVLEASLGYYINPLLSVLLGVLVIGERLTKSQWVAVFVATGGVLIMTIAGGGLPWVSIILACSFASYGLVKKQAPLPALWGMLLETATLSIPAAVAMYIWSRGSPGETPTILGAPDTSTLVILVLGGLVTVLPLALFAFAAQRVPLSTIGVLQYIGPSMQFFIGIVILSEPFDRWRFLGFAFVWAALAIYLLSSRYQPQPNLRRLRAIDADSNGVDPSAVEPAEGLKHQLEPSVPVTVECEGKRT